MSERSAMCFGDGQLPHAVHCTKQDRIKVSDFAHHSTCTVEIDSFRAICMTHVYPD